MIAKDEIQIKTKNSNSYVYLPNSAVILSQEGITKSSDVRLGNLKKLEKNILTNIKTQPFMPEDVKNIIFRNCLNELTLEVTSQCNLRCKYCYYGDDYPMMREHGNNFMELSVAQKAIDSYYQLYYDAKPFNLNRKPVIAFYGCEPLLNFSLIVQCVEYIKSKYQADFEKTVFTLTSNATLLTEYMIHYLKENHFIPIFSLDGPKRENDKHRVNKNNEGVFEYVYAKLLKAYKIFRSPIVVNVVYSIDIDLSAVIEFFSERPEFICINISPVTAINTSYYKQFCTEDYKVFNYRMNELKKEFIEYIKRDNKKEVNTHDQIKIYLLDLLFSRNCLSLITRSLFQIQKAGVQYTSTCMPGERIYVDTDGNYYPCEKIERSRKIGNVDIGLDYKLIAELMNEFKFFTKKCNQCRTKNICPSCLTQFLHDGRFVHDMCEDLINSSLIRLEDYCYISELNNYWLTKFKMDYYKKIKELVVTLR